MLDAKLIHRNRNWTEKNFPAAKLNRVRRKTEAENE